jgi:hypothetical protein
MVAPSIKTIDGQSVYVMPLTGETATLVFYQLQKCLAPALMTALGALKSVFLPAVEAGEKKDGKTKIDFKKFLETDLSRIDFKELSQVFDSIHEKMTAQEWLDFIKLTLSRTTVNNRAVGDKAHFDDVFSGHIMLEYKVLWFTLEANYADFFAVVGSGAMKVSEPQSPTELLKK